jgi:hypothetical protein
VRATKGAAQLRGEPAAGAAGPLPSAEARSLALCITSSFRGVASDTVSGVETDELVSPFLISGFIADLVAEVLDVLPDALDRIAAAYAEERAAKRSRYCCEKYPSFVDAHVPDTFCLRENY